jgi:hypothetical protein
MVAQWTFTTLYDEYPTDKDALKARDTTLRDLRRNGYTARGFTLRNQMRQYAGLGQPDGRVGPVYGINIYERPHESAMTK